MDGSFSVTASYLQPKVSQRFEGYDNRAGIGGAFGSGAKSFDHSTVYDASYGADFGARSTRPMVGSSSTFGSSAAVGPCPHMAGRYFDLSLVSRSFEGHFNTAGYNQPNLNSV